MFIYWTVTWFQFAEEVIWAFFWVARMAETPREVALPTGPPQSPCGQYRPSASSLQLRPSPMANASAGVKYTLCAVRRVAVESFFQLPLPARTLCGKKFILMQTGITLLDRLISSLELLETITFLAVLLKFNKALFKWAAGLDENAVYVPFKA